MLQLKTVKIIIFLVKRGHVKRFQKKKIMNNLGK
jgi:hypothetical protein